MSVLTSSEVAAVYNSGGQLRHVTFTVSGVTSGDTWDASTQFSKVTLALWFPFTGNSTSGYLPVTTNTTITFSTGSSQDAGFLDCIGSAP